MDALGKRLRALRESKELTGREMATVLNVSPSTLSQYETGSRVPSDDVKLKIAAFFGVSIDYLLGLTNDPRPPEAVGNDDPRIEDLDYAFYEGVTDDITEEEKQQILSFAKFIREERKKKG